MSSNDENKDTNNPFDKEITTNEVKNETNEETKEINNQETIEENIEDKNQENTEEEDDDDDFQQKYDELNNKYIRLAADFDNFRKRTQSEKEELSQYTISKILAQLTSVLDTFDRAQEHLKDVEECKTVKDGYEVAYKQLLDVLKKIGLEETDALGKPFNPNEHEAVTQIPTDEYEPDCVAVVMQKGYKIDKRIIRPALVGVAVKKEN